jgi:hypothetical protein
LEPRISIITLGVDDLDRAARFYEAMGLERNEKITEGVAFFQMGGMILALWPREELARDAGVEASANWKRRAGGAIEGEVPRDFSGVALAYNTRSEVEVFEILEKVEKAGGRIVKSAQRAIFGGMQGYFEDTEGNLWEVAHNPDFPIDAEGRISLPE